MEGDRKVFKFEFKKTNFIKPLIKKKIEESEEAVEFIDSFDGHEFSYKGKASSETPVKQLLVIPMPGPKSAYDVIKEKLSKSEETELAPAVVKAEVQNVPLLNELKNDLTEDALDKLATKELIERSSEVQSTEINSKLIIPAKDTPASLTAAPESTLEDYDNVPVTDYGLAMLRGMGWDPAKGVGKDERLVVPIEQKVRPKGLGLGADKVVPKQTQNQKEDLKICKSSFVRFKSGTNKGKYGKVEGFDDNGRIAVKLTLGGFVSTTEFLLEAVTEKEYTANSKVLNSEKYEEYKEIAEKREAKIRQQEAMKLNPMQIEKLKEVSSKKKLDRHSSSEKSNFTHNEVSKLGSDVRDKSQKDSDKSRGLDKFSIRDRKKRDPSESRAVEKERREERKRKKSPRRSKHVETDESDSNSEDERTRRRDMKRKHSTHKVRSDSDSSTDGSGSRNTKKGDYSKRNAYNKKNNENRDKFKISKREKSKRDNHRKHDQSDSDFSGERKNLSRNKKRKDSSSSVESYSKTRRKHGKTKSSKRRDSSEHRKSRHKRSSRRDS